MTRSHSLYDRSHSSYDRSL